MREAGGGSRRPGRYTQTRTSERRQVAMSGVAQGVSGQVAEPGRTATLPDVEQEQRSQSRALEPRKVVLYNDDVNSMDHVVRSLLRSVPGMSTKKAVDVMMEAHN